MTGDASVEGSLAYGIAQVKAGKYAGIELAPSLSGAILDCTTTVPEGTITAKGIAININAQSAASGIATNYSASAVTINDWTGTVSVTVDGLAAGFYSHFDTTNNPTLSGGFTFTGFAGEIDVRSTVEGNAYGISSYRKTTYIENSNISAAVAMDGVGGDISVSATKGLAYDIAAYTARPDYYNRAETTVSTGDITGDITVTASGNAFGIYSIAETAGTCIASITTGDISGDFQVTSSEGSAYGIYCRGRSGNSVTIANITGDMRVSGAVDAVEQLAGGKVTLWFESENGT